MTHSAALSTVCCLWTSNLLRLCPSSGLSQNLRGVSPASHSALSVWAGFAAVPKWLQHFLLLNLLLLNSFIGGLVQLVLREKVSGNGPVELGCRLRLDVSEPRLAQHKIHKRQRFTNNLQGIVCIKTFKSVGISHQIFIFICTVELWRWNN